MTDTSVDQAKGADESKPAVAANETDELDTLLAEFDQENSGKEQQNTDQPQNQPDSNDVASQVAKLVQAQEARDRKDAERDTQDGIQEAIGWGMEVLKEKEISVPDGTEKLFRGFLEAEAQADGRISQAFLNRSSRPSAWKKVVVAKAGEFSKFFQATGKDTQRETIGAAVAGSRSSETKGDGPTAKDYGAMTDQEFRREWRKALGQT